ncbi:MAG: hypothetical protein Q4A62_02650 [Eikenella sp.]|nr:hypothetical protein [Eikenella sp.]
MWNKRFAGLLLPLLALPLPLYAHPNAGGSEIEFLTPSRNIYCTSWQNRKAVSCMAMNHKYNHTLPRPPASCDLDWTPTVELARTGAAKLSGMCHGDLPHNPDAPVLAYGQSVRGRGWRCLLAESGLRCENDSGRGFRLNRRTRQLF